MRCPRDGNRCGKHDTVRRCPGCPLYQQAKAARQALWRERRQAQEQEQVQTQAQWREQAQALARARVQEQAQVQAQVQAREQAQAQAQEQAPVQAQAPVQVQAQAPVRALAREQAQEQAPPAATVADAVAYRYDGSLAGFFCCVYESYYLREAPAEILTEWDAQPTLLYTKTIATDQTVAARVRDSIPAKISGDALDLIETVFLSCLKEKELCILRFLTLAYREGRKTMEMLGNPYVAALLDAEKHLLKEAHLLKGFVRFSDYGGVLASQITPKNFILPFIANHFCERFSEEDFIIFDKNHKAALIYQGRRREIVSLDELPFPEADEAEERYRALWKRFYQTITIEARYNPRCRMTHLPKRYWENMTEMRELL